MRHWTGTHSPRPPNTSTDICSLKDLYSTRFACCKNRYTTCVPTDSASNVRLSQGFKGESTLPLRLQGRKISLENSSMAKTCASKCFVYQLYSRMSMYDVVFPSQTVAEIPSFQQFPSSQWINGNQSRGRIRRQDLSSTEASVE